MTESTLWTWLKGAREIASRRLDMRRMENGISTGDADVDGIYRGRDFAIELKSCKRPARETSKLQFHEVTQAQVDWHSNRQDAGGASCFLIQVGKERYIVHGRLAPILREGVTREWLFRFGQPVLNPMAAVLQATYQKEPSL